jgi:hemerythrin-like metal-binding protein
MDDDLVVWSDAFSVDFPVIDEQHKKLVVITNDLLKCCKEGIVSRTDFLMAFSKASNYAVTHFRDEEDYMKKANYPDLDIHKKEHEVFLAEIKNTFEKFRENDSAPINLAIFLKKWLLNHIALRDKLFTPYLAKLK